ncbi:MAG: pentapeptide repeat-containing protein, partial [Cyanobacteria bacterium J06648_11]
MFVRSLRYALALQIPEEKSRSRGFSRQSQFDADALLQMYREGCRHFAGCVLRDEILQWADLKQANFNRADLSDSLLEGTDFSH